MHRVLRIIFESIVFAVVVIVICTIVSHVCGVEYTFFDGIQMVRYRDEVGVESPDGEYKLVALRDATGRAMLFCVFDKGMNTGPLFVTDDFLFYTRFIKDYGWHEDTDDFYIDSSDTGRYYYQHTDDGWVYSKAG